MKWLDRVKGVSRAQMHNHPDYDFYGLDIPVHAFIIEKIYGDAFTKAALKGIINLACLTHGRG